MRGERVVIGNKKKASVLMLHFDEILHGTKIISKMQISGGANAADYCFHKGRNYKKCLISHDEFFQPAAA
jgi:hypothetical protein